MQYLHSGGENKLFSYITESKIVGLQSLVAGVIFNVETSQPAYKYKKKKKIMVVLYKIVWR